MKKILLTGFEPFNKSPTNASQILVQDLSGELKLPHLILPVSFANAVSRLESHLKSAKYDFVLMLGLASERNKVYLERVGLNLKDSKIPDADGVLASGEKLDDKGEPALFSELPLKKWIENSQMEISNHAGAYVCNCLYYKMLQGSWSRNTLFVHVPPLASAEHKEQIKKDLKSLILKINEELLER